MFSSIRVLIFLICLATLVGSTSKTVFCYYLPYYPIHGIKRFADESSRQVDPHLCTHVAYGYLSIRSNGLIITGIPEFENLAQESIEYFVGLKKKNHNLKVLVSVSVWGDSSRWHISMTADKVKRALFINSVLTFLNHHDLDGLDIHWDIPKTEGKAVGPASCTILLKELKAALNQQEYLLTATVGAAQWSIIQIQNTVHHLDLINVMTYDFHGPSKNFVGHNAPVPDRENKTVIAAIKYWLSVAPASKLVMGIPVYGHTYTLYNMLQSWVGSAAKGPGHPGSFRNISGLLTYNEICDLEDWNKKWDGDALVPYAYKGNQWLSYENVRSIEVKLNVIKEYQLAGAMVWSIDKDDFGGTCGGGKFPLLRAIYNGLNDDVRRRCSDYDESACYCPF